MSKLSLEFETAFQAAALRPATQRYAALEFLVRHPVHATADDISLRSPAHAGLVREVFPEGKAARFDASLHRHHHFLCEQCGAVEDIPWFDLPSAARKAMLEGRAVRSYEILFRDICKSCGCGNLK